MKELLSKGITYYSGLYFACYLEGWTVWFVRGLEDPRTDNSLILASEQPGANYSENSYYQQK